MTEMLNEQERLEKLKAYDILDTDPEESFDRITRVSKNALNVPIALISLVDEDRQWFKSRQGLDAPETARDISFCTHAIKSSQPFIVNDAHEDERFRNNPLVTGDPNIRFYAGVPLNTPGGHNMGTLCVIDREPRSISISEINILRDLARLVVDEMELRMLANLDCLTGLQRRRAFQMQADKELERAQRYDHDMSVIAFDVDYFKKVNDTFGHAAGDLVLQRIAELCKDNLRSMDLIARVGGEEFVVLLPETSLPEAYVTAERLRAEIARSEVEDSGSVISVTSSFGVSDRKSSTRDELRSILNHADQMLYEAKAAGRNQTMPKVA